jgi:FkbM family methyltransferase
MAAVNWESELNRSFMHYPFEFRADEDAMRVLIASKTITAPYEDHHSNISPSYFFQHTHRDGLIYEPRFVAWLLALAENFKGERIVFYDVGSLFGYFSVLANALFDEPRVVAVEPNPQSASYIRRIFAANGVKNATIHEVLLDAQKRVQRYVIASGEGIVIWPGSIRYAFMRIREMMKNTAKRMLNRVAGKTYEIYRIEVKTINTETLESILLPSDPEAIEIMKVDTEGSQALFLPSAASSLIDRSVLVLLEFDSAEKMAQFGSSNGSLVAPFLEAGYALFWCDHRRNDSKVQRLGKVLPEQEHNSLGVLIPKKFVRD